MWLNNFHFLIVHTQDCSNCFWFKLVPLRPGTLPTHPPLELSKLPSFCSKAVWRTLLVLICLPLSTVFLEVIFLVTVFYFPAIWSPIITHRALWDDQNIPEKDLCQRKSPATHKPAITSSNPFPTCLTSNSSHASVHASSFRWPQQVFGLLVLCYMPTLSWMVSSLSIISFLRVLMSLSIDRITPWNFCSSTFSLSISTLRSSISRCRLLNYSWPKQLSVHVHIHYLQYIQVH